MKKLVGLVAAAVLTAVALQGAPATTQSMNGNSWDLHSNGNSWD